MAISIGVAGLVVGTVGVGASVYNASASSKRADEQAAAQQQNQDIINANQKAQSGYQAKALGYQQDAENVRQDALNLDATRRTREVIRAGVSARSNALSIATAQGATGPGSSGLAGATAEISGRTNTNALGISQAKEAGQDIFNINSQIRGVYREAALAGNYTTAIPGGYASSIGAIGAGLTSLGGMALTNANTIDKLGTYAFGSDASRTSDNFNFHNSGNEEYTS